MCGKKFPSISTASTFPLTPAAVDNGTTNSPDPAPRSTTTSPGRSFIAATTSGILSAATRSGASSVATQSSAGRDARCAPAGGASTAARMKTNAALFTHDHLPRLSRFVNECLRVDAWSFAAGARHVLDVGPGIQVRLALNTALAAKLQDPIAERPKECPIVRHEQHRAVVVLERVDEHFLREENEVV